VFEEHREAVDELLEAHVPVLAEETDLFIENGGQMNFLIEGDNLAALRLLLKTYRGRIDLIYIDPPYNTGSNDFMYDDKYVGEDDGYRHSKWMSGYTNDKGKTFPASKGTLKYYRIEFVPITERLYYEYADELLLHIRELVELENGVNFIGNTEIAIVLTDDEMEKFVANIAEFKKCRKLYVGHNVLPTGEQQGPLKKAHIEVNVIPNYYYNELEV